MTDPCNHCDQPADGVDGKCFFHSQDELGAAGEVLERWGTGGYVVTRGGTFGVVQRSYLSETTGDRMIIVRWGPLGWITPIRWEDAHLLDGSYEAAARKEADLWLKSDRDG